MKKRLAVITVLLVAGLLMGGASLTNVFATGSRTTGAVVQNLGDAAATVHLDYYNQAGTVVVYTDTVIQAASSVGFNAGNQSGLSAGFVGSLVVSADQPIAAIGNDTDSDSVGFYSAVTEGSTTLYVPALYKGYGNWFSEIWIQAVEEVPTGATATITFRDRQGNQTGTTKTVNLISYATIKVSPSDYADIPSDPAWAGGAVIVSTYKMGAVVRNTRDTGATGMIAEEYNAFASGDTSVYVPAIYKAYGAWDSNGINVQNLGTVSATVAIDFYDRAGALLHTYTFANQFAPNGGVQAVNTKNITQLANGFAGTAVIRSTNSQPVIGIVDVTSTAQGKGNVYNAVLASEGATEVYLPSQYKRYGGWRSGVIAMNIGASPATVTFEFYARGATTTSAVTSTTVNQYIAFAKNTLNADLGLADGWSGTVVVKSTQPVVVVGNVDGGFTGNAGKAGMYNAFPKP